MSGRRSAAPRAAPAGISGTAAATSRRRDREFGRRLADQHRDRVLELRARSRRARSPAPACCRAGSRPATRRIATAVPASYWFWVMRSDSAKASTERVEQPLQLVGDAQLQIVGWRAGPAPTAGRWRGRRRWPARWRRRSRRCGGPAPTDPASSSPRPCALKRLAMLPPTAAGPMLPLAAAAAARALRRRVQRQRSGKTRRAPAATSASAWRNAASAALRFWFEMSICRSSPSSTGSL